MNNKRRKILGSMAIIAVGMILFPPWNMSSRRGGNSFSYHFIGDPPYSGYKETHAINIEFLTLQLFVLGVVGVILWYLSDKKK